MKRAMTVFSGIAAVVIAASTGALQAQGGQAAQGSQAGQSAKPPSDAAKSQAVQLTGCLAKGTEANSFVLNNATQASTAAGESGKSAATRSYHLTAKEDLKLAGHVGHRVEITGTTSATAAASTGAKTGATAAGTGAGSATRGGPTGSGAGAGAAAGSGAGAKAGEMQHVTVTGMKHIAATCS